MSTQQIFLDITYHHWDKKFYLWFDSPVLFCAILYISESGEVVITDDSRLKTFISETKKKTVNKNLHNRDRTIHLKYSEKMQIQCNLITVTQTQ